MLLLHSSPVHLKNVHSASKSGINGSKPLQRVKLTLITLNFPVRIITVGHRPFAAPDVVVAVR